MMIQSKMQIIYQSLLSFTGKGVKGLLRAAVLLCVLAMPFTKVHAIVEKEAVYVGDTLLWRCQLLGETGTYTDGPSNTMQFSALALPTTENSSQTICKGDTLLWRCMQLWTAGADYKDTAWYDDFPMFAKTYYRLNLQVLEPTEDVQALTICEGDTLLWRCQQLFAAGTYHDTLKSLVCPTCDSVYYTLTLSLSEATEHNESESIHVLENLSWRGHSIVGEAEGVFEYRDTVLSPIGCPQDIYILTLTVLPMVVEEVSENYTICEGDTLLWRCQLLYEANTYYDTIRSLVCLTCDSVRYTMELSFSAATEHPEVAEIFMDDTLLWRCKQIIGESEGVFEYRDTVLSPSGCPQDIYILTLTVNALEPELVETSYTCCGSDTVLWRCQLLTEDGAYYDTLQSYLHPGYDSVYYTFNLKFRTLTIAPWDTVYVKSSDFPYDWNGWVSCATPDEYIYTEKYDKTQYQIDNDLDACDSITHRIRIIQRDTVEMTSCNGDTVLWRCTPAYQTTIYSESVLGVGAISGEEYTTELYYLDFTFHGAPIDSIKNDTVTAIPYFWRTLSIEESGTYRDTVFSVPNDRSSCIDSLFTLNLKIELAKDSLEEVTLCGGDTLLWRCQLVYETGEYHDVLSYDPSGNDSIRFTLNLTIAKDSVAPIEVKYIEPEQSVTWWDADGNLVEYTEPGEHSYQSKYENGCDSVLHRLQIVLYDSTELKSCNGDTILWRCHLANETKIYRDTIREASIFGGGEYDKELYILDFTFHSAPFDSIKADTISSDALPYIWRTRELTESGEYRDTTYYDNDPTGCIDSLFTLNLLVQNITDSLVYDTLCATDTLLWRCQQVFATGIYYDTLRYENSGNDSIRFTLNLTVQKDSVAPLQQEILCNNDSLLWFDGTWLKESGFYEYQSKYAPTLYQEAAGLEGCDSVYHSIVIVARHVRDTVMTDTICESDADDYMWRGLSPNIPDGDSETKYYLYDTARYVGSTECDSMRFMLELTVQRATRMTALDTTVCKDDVINFIWNPYHELSGFTVTTTAYDTARYAITGCDSVIYQLNLRVLEPLADTIVTDTTLCYTDVMEWFGQTYNEAGRYEHTVFYTGTECDSVYCRLQLHYHAEPDTVPDAITICEGAQPYLWHGQTITTDGIYWDSTYYDGTQCINRYFKLEVSMLSPTVVDTTATFCQGGSFLWDRTGELLTDTGTYEYKIPYQVLDGCDSLIIHLHLGMIEPKEMPIETAYICDGENYVWHGHTYNATGVYLDTIASVLTGCDSLYYALNLERQPAMQTQKDTLYICNGEPVVWPFNQQTYTHGGIYNHTIPSSHGCDSIAGELRVVERTTDVQAPENVSIYATQSYTWINGVTYTEAGSYDYIVPFLDGNCDSIIYTLNLTVLDIEHTIVEVTDIICPGETYESRVINEHTQWADTVRTEVDGALVDIITKYDIDVYEFTMPDGFMGFVVAACGMPVNVDSALSLLQKHIDSYENYAQGASIAWSYREDNGQWKTLDGTSALSGQTENVSVRCELTTDCGVKTQEQSYEVGKRATPETFTEYDLLPVIVKYNGTMLMVDVDAICTKFGWTNGVEITPEVVQWYQRVGETDNLSYPNPNDPKDIPTNKWGYYYVPSDDMDYYALIKGKLDVQEEDCGVWARTLVVEGASPIQLNPNVSQGGASIAVTGTTQCYVTVSDMYGNIVMARTAVSGSFKAPANAGTYFVQIEDGVTVAHRTLIVY